MSIFFIKIFRFLMNFVFFTVILYSMVHYSYTSDPELFGIKNALLPYEAAVFLGLIISMILAGINEITTIIILKSTNRKRK